MKLIADLNNKLEKVPYRVMKVEYGIDRFEIMVPLDNARAFKEAVIGRSASKSDLLKILAEHGGKVKA